MIDSRFIWTDQYRSIEHHYKMFCTYEYFSETTKSILILCKMHVKTSAYKRAGFENKEIL